MQTNTEELAIEALEKLNKIENLIEDYKGSHCIYLISAAQLLDEIEGVLYED